MRSYFRCYALDYDGTIAFGPRPEAAVLRVIAELREAGRRVVLVTGRILRELRADFPEVDQHFDAIVAENGAVVSRPGFAARPLAPPIVEALAAALVARDVQFRRGDVLLAADGRHGQIVLEEIGRLGLELQIIRNRDALMVLPTGVSKGTGLLDVLGELGVSHHSAMGVGDAENDHSLLEVCEVGVAVANAVDSLKARADIVLEETGGAALASFLRQILVGGWPGVEPRRWNVELGTYDDKRPATLPAARHNVLVRGGSGTGKSYVAGLLAEELIRLGYTVFVFDLEGDHAPLGQLRGVVTLGGREPLPPPEELVRLAKHRFGSVVVDLSLQTDPTKCAYTCAALPLLRREREATGLPHWIVVDEAHLPLGHVCDECDCPAPGETGFCFVTYLADKLCCRATAIVDTVLTVELGRVQVERAGRAEGSFIPRERTVAHVRHRHKYEEAALSARQRFYFRDGAGWTGHVAGNLLEFREQLQRAPEMVIRHHAAHHDFSRWIAGVFQDARLAGEARRAEDRVLGEKLAADGVADLVRAVEDRYAAAP